MDFERRYSDGMKELEEKSCGADAKDAKALVVLFHGFGASAQDILGLGHAWSDALPSVRFIALEAPFAVPSHENGRQWFALHDLDLKRIWAEMDVLVAPLKVAIEKACAQSNLTWQNVVLTGFSQGAALAMTQGLYHLPVAGILSYSGILALDPSGQKTCRKAPVCLVHGDQDFVVPLDHFDAAQTMLKDAQVSFEAHLDAGVDHTISPFGLSKGLAFFKRVLKV
ncbi:MAG: alpha/beta hydrolase [Holosporaceae bacterium]